MSNFSKRNLAIFVAALLLGTLLIGFGIAYKIQLKQRILPGSSNNADGSSFSQRMIVHRPNSVANLSPFGLAVNDCSLLQSHTRAIATV